MHGAEGNLVELSSSKTSNSNPTTYMYIYIMEVFCFKFFLEHLRLAGKFQGRWNFSISLDKFNLAGKKQARWKNSIRAGLA